MKRLLLVSVLVFVPAALGKSDAGCAPATCGIATVAQPGARVLAVRPNGRRGRAGRRRATVASRTVVDRSPRRT